MTTTMNQLPTSTIRLISSSQVISSVTSAVKELLENALDAGATSLEVKLEGWGLQKIDVRDNGYGIDAESAAYMGQPHYTSKISCHNDLEKLTTYGFRGEALASLCAVSNVTITTKTESSAVATCYTLDQSGSVSATKPAASATGTAVTVTDLFKNLPVRKRFSSNPKKCKEEFKRVEELLMAYGLIHPALRIVLRHNKMMVWQKSRVSDHRTALLSVFGTGLMSQMEEARFPGGGSGEVDVLAFLPKLHSDPNVTSRAVNDRCFIFINDRPVVLKQAAQLIKQSYYKATPGAAASRHPYVFLSVKVPPSELDVNLDPNKGTVLLKDKDELLAIISDILEKFYSEQESKSVAVGPETAADARNGVNIAAEETKNAALQKKDDERLAGQDLEGRSIDRKHSVNGNKKSSTGRECAATTCVSRNLPLNGSESNSICSNVLGQPESTHASADVRHGREHTGSVLPVRSYEQDFSPQRSLEEEQHQCVGEEKRMSDALDTGPEKEDCVPNSGESSVHVDAGFMSNSQLGTGGSLENLSPEPAERTDQSCNLSTSPMESDVSLFSISGSENDSERPLSGVKDMSSRNDELCDPENLLDDTDLDHILRQSAMDEGACDLGNSNKGDAEDAMSESAHLSKSHTAQRPSAKDWSMGHGLVDAQGKSIQPVTLHVSGSFYGNSLRETIKGTPSPSGKRKHSSPYKGHNKLSLAKRKVNKLPKVINQAMITTHLSPSPKQRMFLSAKKEVQFSLKELKDLYQSSQERMESQVDSEPDRECHLIGRLDPWGVWVIQRDNEVMCLNQYRLQERLLFERLRSCHSLPKEELDRAITLNERMVGGADHWQILCDMKSEFYPPDPTRYFTEEKLTANGFELRQRTDPSSGEVRTEVSAMCTILPFYGVPDLVEILGLVRNSAEKSHASLASIRPLKVINYLKSEAVRISRGLSSRMSRSDVTEVLSHMRKHLPDNTTTCLHDRPFFQKIVDLSEQC